MIRPVLTEFALFLAPFVRVGGRWKLHTRRILTAIN